MWQFCSWESVMSNINIVVIPKSETVGLSWAVSPLIFIYLRNSTHFQELHSSGSKLDWSGTTLDKQSINILKIPRLGKHQNILLYERILQIYYMSIMESGTELTFLKDISSTEVRKFWDTKVILIFNAAPPQYSLIYSSFLDVYTYYFQFL